MYIVVNRILRIVKDRPAKWEEMWIPRSGIRQNLVHEFPLIL